MSETASGSPSRLAARSGSRPTGNTRTAANGGTPGTGLPGLLTGGLAEVAGTLKQQPSPAQAVLSREEMT